MNRIQKIKPGCPCLVVQERTVPFWAKYGTEQVEGEVRGQVTKEK